MQTVGTDIQLPQDLYLETTSRCNLRCKGCILFRGGWETQRDLSLKELIMICDQLPVLSRVALHGIGEPLLNDELPDMIRYLKDRKAYVFINSNGTLLNERRGNQLINAGLDELRISLDAASPAVYKAVRNSDEFDRVVANVRAFSIRIRSMQVPRPNLSLWFLGTRENISELPDFVQLAASLGVAEVYLQRLVYFQDDKGYGLARSEKTLMGSDAAINGWINESHDIAEKYGIRLNAPGFTSPFDSLQANAGNAFPWRKCYRPHTLMYITAGGNVLPCCISPFAVSNYDSIILGNVFNRSLSEIWSGSRYRIFRKKRQTQTPPECCRGCDTLWSL